MVYIIIAIIFAIALVWAIYDTYPVLVIVAGCILVLVGMVKLVGWIKAKNIEIEEEERKKEKEEQYRTQAQKRKENFRNRLPSNIIITDVVPQVGKKWATELIEEFKSYTYMKRSLNVKVFDDHISIGSTSIYFNQYGLKNLYDDDRMDVYSAVISALEASVNAELKARVNTHYFVYSEYEHSYTLPYGFIKCTLGIDTRQSW